MGKGFIFIGLAVFIDGLQAWLDWAFLGIGGLITGATAGIAAPVAIPLGIGLGMAINFVISATFGVMLITGLGMFKLWDSTTIMAGGLFELIPGFDCLPGWTVMTVRCVMKAKAKEGSGALSKIAAVASASTPAAAVIEVAANENRQTPRVGQEAYAQQAA